MKKKMDKLSLVIGDLRMVLWQWGLGGNKCPYCGSELMEHSFFPNEYFTCLGDKDCPFNDNCKEFMKEFEKRMK